MPQMLPLVPSVPSYRVSTTLGGTAYVLDVRWNAREEAWYMDLLDAEESPIWRGAKVVLGAMLGARSVDPRKPAGLITASDLSGSGQEAGLHDMGERVRVYFFPAEEL